jgi:hypothetical protein
LAFTSERPGSNPPPVYYPPPVYRAPVYRERADYPVYEPVYYRRCTASA